MYSLFNFKIVLDGKVFPHKYVFLLSLYPLAFRNIINAFRLFHVKRASLMYNVNIFHINNTHTCYLAVKPSACTPS